MSEDVQNLESNHRLELTQQIRIRAINKLTKDGGIPDSQEDRDFLIKMLDGTDRQELTKAKIKSDEKSAKAQSEINNMVTQLLLRTTDSVVRGKREKPLELVEEVPLKTVDGETSIGTKNFTYKEIMDGEAP